MDDQSISIPTYCIIKVYIYICMQTLYFSFHFLLQSVGKRFNRGGGGDAFSQVLSETRLAY